MMCVLLMICKALCGALTAFWIKMPEVGILVMGNFHLLFIHVFCLLASCITPVNTC